MLESIRKIIVPTEFSELSETALRSAAKLASDEDASIHLLHSIRLPFLHTNYDVNVPEAVWEGIRKGTRERMSESKKLLEEAGVSEVGIIVSESRQPAEAISQSVRELGADLVVMASHGRRGLKHAFLGSVTERTIRSSPVPVLAVKGEGITQVPLRRILLPTDFSSHSARAMSLATTLAQRWDAHVDIIHVRDRTPDYLKYGSAAALEFDKDTQIFASASVEELADELREKGRSAAIHLPEGIAADVIAEEADRLDSDLIVMGTHGFTGFAHAVIGSVAERTLRLAPCPVLTTKAAPDASASVS